MLNILVLHPENLRVLPKNTPNPPVPRLRATASPSLSHIILLLACNSFPTRIFAFILETHSSYNRQRNPFEKYIPSDDCLCT